MARVPKRGSPFSLAILEEGLPPNFRQSNIGEYDGHTDPEEHLGRFENAALLHQYSNRVRCRVFLGTLVRSAQQWFNTLQPNSIQSFDDFSTAFLHRFASSKSHQINYLSLFVMKQQEAETLREFVLRLNSAALEIPEANPDIIISAFTQGLRGGEFFKLLVKKPPSSYDDLLARAEKYINLEDAQRYGGTEGWRIGPGEVGWREPREVVIREVQSTLDQMKVEGFEFEPISTPLYGFAGHAIPPLGQIVLPLSLGHEPRRSCSIHISSEVEISCAEGGWSVVTRRCYEGIVKEEGKRARVEVNMIRRGRSGLPVVVREVHEVIDEKPEIVTLGPDKKTLRIAPDLDPEVREKLITCLQANLSGFAWSAQELTGTSPDVAEHRLNIFPNSRPVKQKKRHFGPEKDIVIKKEVGELLNAGHIREVQFPTWLSNVVLVPKSSGKWRMCADFRDLNKACPKDCYPLPRIDQLVESTAGHQYLCMLDAYQGYHQIPLAVEDQDKVSFITSEGTFCYMVMPFGLKNAGATYQRLMDRVFSQQVGRNVEVYVDDIMVKSKDSSQLIPDLVETFSTLRSYGLKLNPQKCVFGVKSGKFLGYMVTERGIEANPEKVQAIQDMVSPQGPKDVHQLTGRIAALACFILRSAHRSLPFFRTLRKAKKFEWEPDCEKAFTKLKDYLAELPVLAKPAAREPLWVYLSATEGAVSSVLVKLDGSVQQLVYYVSHALKGAEIRYSGLEKLALALVMTARRLRPCFLSHPIVVLTNSPLGRILTYSDISGRLIKWTTELGEYDIQYEPRTSIKAQALADFLAETVHIENEDPWKVYVDGSSSKDGSEVGVVLISPAGEEVKLAVRLDFRASNNEAEYEAVLAGLRAARNMGATRIPRKENEKADTLAKMAGTMGSWKTRDVVFQVELTPHTSSLAVEQEEENWRTIIIDYLNEGKLPVDPREARKLKRRCSRYVMIGEVLYRTSFAGPLLRCLSYQEADYVLREVHEGCCGNHLGAYALARKALLAGYTWPSVLHDAQELVMSCDSCQRHARLHHRPAAMMKAVIAACLFDQ
ncbi:uncharacterized protein [Primulina huaijiensis]|uniref:uncharacterized protein n=1 Tax=Primulina huaijiensis TaxID=1492673 RepID=UPI003CC792ED